MLPHHCLAGCRSLPGGGIIEDLPLIKAMPHCSENMIVHTILTCLGDEFCTLCPQGLNSHFINFTGRSLLSLSLWIALQADELRFLLLGLAITVFHG